jgi:hypothetical protein
VPVPTTKVFIAFDLTAAGGSYFTLDDTVKGRLNSVYFLGGEILTDVTQYVSSVSINRGKSREQDRYTAGNLSVSLHNESRIFDPFNSQGIFAGQVLPRKAIAVETNGVRMFTGIIDDWDFTYDVNGKAFADVSAVDGFLILSAAELDSFTATSQLSSDRVTAILNRPEVNWPTGQRQIGTGLTTLQADVVPENTNALSYLQLVEETENGQLFINKSGQVTFKNRLTVPPENNFVIFTDANSFVVNERFNLIPNSSFEVDINGWTGSNVTGVRSSLFSEGRVETSGKDSGTFGSLSIVDPVTTPPTAIPQTSKFGTWSYQGSVATTGTNRYIEKSPTDVFITAGLTYSYSCYVFLPVTNTADVTLKLQAVPYAGVSALATIDLDTELIERGKWLRMQGTFTAPATATNCAFRVINEASMAAGQLIYIDGALLEQSESVSGYFDGASYGCSFLGTAFNSISQKPTIANVNYTNIGVIYGTENLTNRVTITRAGGTPQTADSTRSQAAYGIASTSKDGLLLTSDTEALALANYLTGIYQNPELRINEVTVVLENKNDVQIDRLTAIEIGDVVQVVFTPTGNGTQIDQFAVVVSIKNNIGIDRHSMTFGLGAVNIYPLILDDPYYGRLGGRYPLYDTVLTSYDNQLVDFEGIELPGFVLAY